MAVPKRRTSRSKTASRRNHKTKLPIPQLLECQNCGEKFVMHSVCKKCGHYKGKEILPSN